MSDNIWVAAADNKIDLVKSHIESGKYTPNSSDPNGFTPIHAAASYGNIELLKYLLTNGGNPNIQDSDGDTPLHHCESLDVIKLLINEFNANYRLKNNDGLNVKDYFIEEDEFPDIIEFLTILEKTGDSSNTTTIGTTNDTTKLSLPNGAEIKAFLDNATMATGNEEDETEEMKLRRKQVQQIFENTELSDEQRDEQLRNYVMGVVSENMEKLRNSGDANNDGENDAENSHKRRK